MEERSQAARCTWAAEYMEGFQDTQRYLETTRGETPETGKLARLLREWRQPMGVGEYDGITASRERSCLCGRTDRREKKRLSQTLDGDSGVGGSEQEDFVTQRPGHNLDTTGGQRMAGVRKQCGSWDDQGECIFARLLGVCGVDREQDVGRGFVRFLSCRIEPICGHGDRKLRKQSGA